MDDDIGDADLERQRRAEVIQRARRENDKRSAELQQDIARRVLSGSEPMWWNHRCRFDGSLEPQPPQHERGVDTDLARLIEDRIAAALVHEREIILTAVAERFAELVKSREAELAKTRSELRDVRIELAKLH